MLTNTRNLSLSALATELEERKTIQKDFLISPQNIEVINRKVILKDFEVPENPEMFKTLSALGVKGNMVKSDIKLDPNAVFRNQMAVKLNVPATYFDRVYNQHTDLFDFTCNQLLSASTNDRYMLRTYCNGTNIARAMLSDRYKIIDNYDVLITVLNTIKNMGINVEIVGCDITEKRMYVRFVVPEIEVDGKDLVKNYRSPGGAESQVGDGIISGFTITNSEVGQGTFTLAFRGMVKKCMNGLIMADDSFIKKHLGAKLDDSVNWSDKTETINMHLTVSQIEDTITQYLNKDYLYKVINKYVGFAEVELKNPGKVIELAGKQVNISKEDSANVLNYFIKGGDTSAFGVAQAFTYFAHETKDADTQHEVENKIFTLLPKFKEYDRATMV